MTVAGLSAGDIGRLVPASTVEGASLIPIVQDGQLLSATVSQLGGGGQGNVVYGPATPIEGAVAIWEDPEEPGSLGDTLLNSNMSIDGSGNISGVGTLSTTGAATIGGAVAIAGVATIGNDTVPGQITLYPGMANHGTLTYSMASNGNNKDATIIGGAFTLDSVITIQDPGQTTADFVLSESPGTQTIHSSLAVNNLAIANGGTLSLASNSTGSGSMVMSVVDAAGSFGWTVNWGQIGENVTLTFPDPGASTANVLLTNSNTVQTVLSPFYVNNILSANSVNVGFNGGVGTLTLYPTSANQGLTTWTMSNNAGNTTTNINVATQAAARTYTLPDAGTNSSFVLADGDRTINDDTTLTGALNGTSLVMGSSGNSGELSIFPPAATSGNLLYSASNSAGNFLVTITNTSFGQATVLSYPDPGVAAANFNLYISKGQVTLATGAATITDAAITANTTIRLELLTVGGSIAGLPFIDTKTMGSATVTGGGALNTSTYVYYVSPE